MEGMTNLLDLRAKFVDILDIEKGDGACALSLLDEVINAEQLKPTPFNRPKTESKVIPEVYSLGEAIEFFAEQFFSEMSFDEIHDLAVELLEQRIHQLTQLLNEKDN
jgi:hypothetical protein